MDEKQKLRREIRQVLKEKFDLLSERQIAEQSEPVYRKLTGYPPLQGADRVMIYFEMPREFPITPMIPSLLTSPSRHIVIPWCDGERLRLFRLISAPEPKQLGKPVSEIIAGRLAPGAFGIREPKETLRRDPAFLVRPEEIDFLVLPGLAFDPQCRRLGRGKGFYDRFQTDLRPGIPRVGVAFDEQIVDSVPVEPHDLPLDWVMTPSFSFVSPASPFR